MFLVLYDKITMATHEVTGKSFLITGGASGLGAHYARAFLQEGAKQVALLDIAEEVGKAFAEELNQTYPGKVIFVRCDVGDENSLSAAFEQVVAKFGRLDVVFNNAGIMSDNPKVWWKMCSVNVQGLVYLTLKGISHMRKDEGGAGGTIINVASIAALDVNNLLPIYCGTKSAVMHFSQCVSGGNFHEQTGIRVLCICPAGTDTALLQKVKERGNTENNGEILAKYLDDPGFYKQKPESAAAAVVKMFKEGANGSVWLTAFDKPGKDITPVISAAFKTYSEAIANV